MIGLSPEPKAKPIVGVSPTPESEVSPGETDTTISSSLRPDSATKTLVRYLNPLN